MRSLVFCFLVLISAVIGAVTASNAQAPPPTITFDNQSGKAALVGLIGPKDETVEVPNGQKRTVPAKGGQYCIVTRYGTSSEGYAYSKGDPFTVTQTATQRSVITITLHPVPHGNYRHSVDLRHRIRESDRTTAVERADNWPVVRRSATVSGRSGACRVAAKCSSRGYAKLTRGCDVRAGCRSR